MDKEKIMQIMTSINNHAHAIKSVTNADITPIVSGLQSILNIINEAEDPPAE